MSVCKNLTCCCMSQQMNVRAFVNVGSLGAFYYQLIQQTLLSDIASGRTTLRVLALCRVDILPALKDGRFTAHLINQLNNASLRVR